MRPFHPLQVLSWGVFGIDVLVFGVFVLPLVQTTRNLACVAACFALSVLVLVLSAAKAMYCDPADPNIRLRNEINKLHSQAELDKMPFCLNGCQSRVHPSSKHCHSCGKCVKVFDHHCIWLNNCIGELNYRAFFTVISSVMAMVGITLGVSVYMLVEYFVAPGDSFAQSDSIVLRHISEEVILAILFVLTFVNFPLFVLDSQLLILHMFLASNNMTTYDYINNKKSVLGIARTPRGAGADGGAAKTGRRHLVLPKCMDWIVFARCGRGRRRRPAGAAAAATAAVGVPVTGDVDGATTSAGTTVGPSKDGAVAKNSATTSTPAPPPVAKKTEATGWVPHETADYEV